mmetsp:Transcript_25226/g.72641  ORF Transcript_25226/g.72641 Transcript_25226/m.72641 type:complete len:211 (+) Transcript_25226:164-796(+)
MTCRETFWVILREPMTLRTAAWPPFRRLLLWMCEASACSTRTRCPCRFGTCGCRAADSPHRRGDAQPAAGAASLGRRVFGLGPRPPLPPHRRQSVRPDGARPAPLSGAPKACHIGAKLLARARRRSARGSSRSNRSSSSSSLSSQRLRRSPRRLAATPRRRRPQRCSCHRTLRALQWPPVVRPLAPGSAVASWKVPRREVVLLPGVSGGD